MSESQVVYEKDGTILSVNEGISLSSETLKTVFPEWEKVEVLEASGYVTPSTHYVAEGAVRERQTLDTAHRVSGLRAIFEALPAGIRVRVKNQVLVTDEQPTALRFDMPGRYRVFFEGTPKYLDQAVEVSLG